MDERLVGYHDSSVLCPRVPSRGMVLIILPGGFKNGNLRMETGVTEWERLKYVIMRAKYRIYMMLAFFLGTANLCFLEY